MTEATFHSPRSLLNAVAPESACEPTARHIAQSPRGRSDASDAAKVTFDTIERHWNVTHARHVGKERRPHVHATATYGPYPIHVRHRCRVPLGDRAVRSRRGVQNPIIHSQFEVSVADGRCGSAADGKEQQTRTKADRSERPSKRAASAAIRPFERPRNESEEGPYERQDREREHCQRKRQVGAPLPRHAARLPTHMFRRIAVLFKVQLRSIAAQWPGNSTGAQYRLASPLRSTSLRTSANTN